MKVVIQENHNFRIKSVDRMLSNTYSCGRGKGLKGLSPALNKNQVVRKEPFKSIPIPENMPHSPPLPPTNCKDKQLKRIIPRKLNQNLVHQCIPNKSPNN